MTTKPTTKSAEPSQIKRLDIISNKDGISVSLVLVLLSLIILKVY